MLLLPVAACSPSEEDRPPAKAETKVQDGGDYGLVELIKLEPGLKLDIRYATADNFTGQILYKQARAFMRREPAGALIAAHKALPHRAMA